MERYGMHWKHVGLMVLAFGTMLLAGANFGGLDAFSMETWSRKDGWVSGLSYAIPLFIILFAHEMGHYVQCKHRGVPATFPVFMPGIWLPGAGLVPFIGTFGAFIRMEVRPMSAKSLLAIGAWGPIAGFVFTVPALLWGIGLSDIRSLPEDLSETMFLGNSLLLLFGEYLFFPNIPEGHDVYLHPMAMAGWTGCLLTALNLIPVGQLDGGHIVYSVLGRRWEKWVYGVFGILMVLGLTQFPGWLFLGAFVAFTGIRHPQMMEGEPVRGRMAWEAWACLVIFVLCFSPAPIEGVSLIDMIWN